MYHVPFGVQGSVFADDYVVYGSSSLVVEAGHKTQGAIEYATDWAKS